MSSNPAAPPRRFCWALLLWLLLTTTSFKRRLLFLVWIYFAGGWARANAQLGQYKIVVALDTILGPPPRFLAQAVPAITMWLRESECKFDRLFTWLIAIVPLAWLLFHEWSRGFEAGMSLREQIMQQCGKEGENVTRVMRDGIPDHAEALKLAEEKV